MGKIAFKAGRRAKKSNKKALFAALVFASGCILGFAFKSSILEALAATKVPQGASQTEAWQEVKIAPLVPSSAMLKAKAPVGFAILAKQKR